METTKQPPAGWSDVSVIEVDGLRKEFGDVTVLDDLSFAAEFGLVRRRAGVRTLVLPAA